MPEKLKSLQEMPPPTDLTETRKFLGFVGYYRVYTKILRHSTSSYKPDQKGHTI